MTPILSHLLATLTLETRSLLDFCRSTWKRRFWPWFGKSWPVLVILTRRGLKLDIFTFSTQDLFLRTSTDARVDLNMTVIVIEYHWRAQSQSSPSPELAICFQWPLYSMSALERKLKTSQTFLWMKLHSGKTHHSVNVHPKVLGASLRHPNKARTNVVIWF